MLVMEMGARYPIYAQETGVQWVKNGSRRRLNLWRPLVRSYLQTQHFSKDVQFQHLDLHRFPLHVFFSSSLAHEDCRFFSWTFVRFSFCWFFSSWFLGRIQLPVQWTGWVLDEITAGHWFHRFFVLPLKSLTFSLLKYVVFIGISPYWCGKTSKSGATSNDLVIVQRY